MKLNKVRFGSATPAKRLSIKQHSSVRSVTVSIGIFAFAFLATLLASSSLTPVSNSSAEDVAAVINSSGYFINLISKNSGLASMDLVATAAGTVGITKDTINIKSNAPNGYDLYLSMDNSNTDGNRLYKDANSSSSSYLSPTSGTFSAPAVLDTNSWGYALSSTTPGLPASNGGNNGNGGSGNSGFDETYSTTGPNDNALFAAVPLQGQEQLIQTITTPDSTNGVDTEVYYGVKANTSLPSGSYKGTVTYTAIAKTNSGINEQTSVSPSVTTKLEGGEILTIATMLNIDASVAEDPGTPADPNIPGSGTPAKNVTVTVGGEPCPLTTGIYGDPADPTTTDGLGNAQDGSLVITCTAPSMATGRYDVGIDVPKYDKFWVIVNGIQYKYSTSDQDQAITDATAGTATAADILLGKTAYVGGQELTGTMPSYTLQYDTNKTAEENTEDSGLTWSSDGATLIISEGYHAQQQVNSQRDPQSIYANVIDLGTGTSFDVTSYSGYENFTAANFIVEVPNSSRNNGATRDASEAGRIYRAYLQMAKSYSNGILSAYISYGVDKTTSNNSGWNSGYTNSKLNVHAYLVY